MKDDDRRRLDRLEVVEARWGVLNALYAYGHAIDYNLADAWLSCFTRDAELLWPGRDRIVGRDGLSAALDSIPRSPDLSLKHLVIQPMITIRAAEARSISYYVRLEYLRGGEPGQPRVGSFGRYEDDLVRDTSGIWRIRRRKAVHESGATASNDPYDDSVLDGLRRISPREASL